MTSLWQMLVSTPIGNGADTAQLAIGLALALLLGQLAAWTYMRTHAGISYSRAFVQSIVLLNVIVALAMMVIGNNVIVAFGLLGALSMIRFRNVLKDTRDTAFVFFSVVTGIACGTGCHVLAVAGTVLFCLLVVLLYMTSFGAKHDGDAFLRFQCDADAWKPQEIEALLRRHCISTHMVTQRIAETGHMELAFQLVMRDHAGGHALVEELRKQGLSAITFVFQVEESEV